MSIILSRQELYERVWTHPIWTLSKELGLSDVGLTKVCHKRNIPTPPRGYWAKIEAGKRVNKPALPATIPRGYEGAIEFAGPREAAPPPEPAEPLHPLIAAERDPANAITVPERVRVVHPTLQATRQFWRDLKRPFDARNFSRADYLFLAVGEKSRDRACRLLQVLFSALERRGHRVGRSERGKIQATVLDESCVFDLRERQRQVRNPPPPKSKTSIFDRPRPFELVYTGEFEMRFSGSYPTHIIRDGKSGQIETKLNEAVEVLIQEALHAKVVRANAEKARIAAAEAEQRREKARRIALQEKAKIVRLERLIDAVTNHRRKREFLSDLQAAIGEINPNSELGRWVDWVSEHVQRSDVLGRFKGRRSMLTLYYCAYAHEASRILKEGFVDRDHYADDDVEARVGVDLSDVPMEGIHGGTKCILIDITEDDVLPYEVTKPTDEHRSFVLPAVVANRSTKRYESD